MELVLPDGEWPEALVVAYCDEVFSKSELSSEERALAAMGKWRLQTYRPTTVAHNAESVPFLRCFVHSVATTPQGEFLLNWYHNSGVVVENIYAGLPTIFEAWELTMGPWMRAALRYGIAYKDETVRAGVLQVSPEEWACRESIYNASPWCHTMVQGLRPWLHGAYPTAFGDDPEGRSAEEYRVPAQEET